MIELFDRDMQDLTQFNSNELIDNYGLNVKIWEVKALFWEVARILAVRSSFLQKNLLIQQILVPNRTIILQPLFPLSANLFGGHAFFNLLL